MKMEKFKERIEKAAGEIPRVIYKETSIRLSVDFLAESFQARRVWHDIFKSLKGKYLQFRILYPEI